MKANVSESWWWNPEVKNVVKRNKITMKEWKTAGIVEDELRYKKDKRETKTETEKD